MCLNRMMVNYIFTKWNDITYINSIISLKNVIIKEDIYIDDVKIFAPLA